MEGGRIHEKDEGRERERDEKFRWYIQKFKPLGPFSSEEKKEGGTG